MFGRALLPCWVVLTGYLKFLGLVYIVFCLFVVLYRPFSDYPVYLGLNVWLIVAYVVAGVALDVCVCGLA